MIQFAQSRLLLLLTLCVAAVGCADQQTKSVETAARPVVTGNSSPTAQAEAPVENDDSYMQKVTQMFNEAKAAGRTTASNAGEWIGDLYESARSTGNDLATDTADQVRNLYENAKAGGETTAGDVKEWVAEDLQQHGAWQYRAIVIESQDPQEIAAELNKLGTDRWNCFWVDKQDGRTTFYMKKAGRSYLHQLPAKELLLMMSLMRGGGSDGATE